MTSLGMRRGNGIENVKLFHNGKSIPIYKESLKLPVRKGESTTYRHVINLVGGSNTITASASNKEKIESDPQSVEVFSERSGKSSVCYILSVGINLYKNPKMLLNYARPDAESFSKVMDEKGSLFKNIEVHSLYAAEASKSNILKKLEELSGKIQKMSSSFIMLVMAAWLIISSSLFHPKTAACMI